MSALNIKKGSTSHSAHDLRTANSEVNMQETGTAMQLRAPGKPHNEMLLGDADMQGVIGSEGTVLV
jgi:hypothetical protein